jgi:hypothetical protein
MTLASWAAVGKAKTMPAFICFPIVSSNGTIPGQMSSWIRPGLDRAEGAKWLAGLNNNIGPFVFNCGIASVELFHQVLELGVRALAG